MHGQSEKRAPRSRYRELPAYTTRDGSTIRELMHPAVHGNARQSLAEASLAPGQSTHAHRHLLSEEIYHVTAGSGEMRLCEECFEIKVGDTVCIPPGTVHALRNTGTLPLRVLCCCSPAYAHEDTELVE